MSSLLWILLALAVLVGGWIVVAYNRLVAARQRSREGWSGIDVQLKRRSNLVPNLVATVKGYASHEAGVLKDVTESRAHVQASEGAGAGVGARQQAEGELSSALGRLFAVAENYPDLKADSSFLELQRNLAALEDQIQMARRYYNGSVRELNTRIESFPSNLVARRFGFQPAEYYEVEHAGDRLLPKVAF
ncbi:LemA protein [Tistlia consotensis]|uniref:LemA protein n=1 Tax=Tistlia consotensis USBA 355 TaxID=560819 RepID=A0A1Y6C3X0_9PROT|nr:LemA family protein [Tistlia consotensis]SMF35970.1 LemA protein [Tistlia consotensis USBA 355]SNR71175.1 LemA protein [Tistlia consotensis]